MVENVRKKYQPQQQIFGTRAAADLLGVSPKTVIRWIQNGHLRGRQISGSYRIAREAIDDLKEALKETSR